jgi:hypothetical protein
MHFDDDATVVIRFRKVADDPVITALQAKGGNWIEIGNDTGEAVSTKGLYLSDSGNLFKWRLPGIVIQPGETVLVKTGSSTTKDTLKRAHAGFGISHGERLRLTDATTGVTLQRIEVTLMTAEQVQERHRDGRFRIVIR